MATVTEKRFPSPFKTPTPEGAEGWESRSHNSCFAGRTLSGRVLMTMVAGRVAYRQRSFAMGVA